jgi:Lon protease-like protein
MSLEVPIMPLNAVLFPGMPMPLIIFEQRYLEMISRCLEQDNTFGVALIEEGREVGGAAIPKEIGTTAVIAHTADLDGGGMQVLAVGRQRFVIRDILAQEPFIMAEVDLLEEQEAEEVAPELVEELREMFGEHLKVMLTLLGQPPAEITMPDSPARLSYMVAAHLTTPPSVHQRLLEMDSIDERLFHEKQLLQKETRDYRLLLASRAKYEELVGGDTEQEIFSAN